MDFPALLDRVESVLARSDHPIVVGISGFGGSGKSTLARRLASAIDGCVRLRGDDFLDPERSHRRSADWDGVDRRRLVAEVLEPFRNRTPGTYRPLDWSTRALGAPMPVPSGELMVVDVVGLFHPEAIPSLDMTVWCDVDIPTATDRGMRRDADVGRRHERLWREVWVPNEVDFVERFHPRATADLLFHEEAAP